MRVRTKLFIMLFLIPLSLLTSCNTNDEDPYAGKFGKKIEEDLVSTNIIEDNYRNYYEIFVRSFNDSNMDLIGDLNGVTNKLDYIKDLGYNGIWLMPINPSDSYHKYDVNDYYSVDKTYGTIDDLKNLIDECHKRNIKLILDLVFNHSGKANPYFSKACRGSG
jgi:1,4-alpha-glucan branching enzyme